ncbi:MAG: hypothetical protein HN356_00325 [Calditrichaeota bacterium]|jgi:hypothetical protein|nr:hypothetical protein [Calditrichota bacterium]
MRRGRGGLPLLFVFINTLSLSLLCWIADYRDPGSSKTIWWGGLVLPLVAGIIMRIFWWGSILEVTGIVIYAISFALTHFLFLRYVCGFEDSDKLILITGIHSGFMAFVVWAGFSIKDYLISC